VSRVLITGGAGFIGSHMADALLARGDDVVLLDALHPQVHGPEQRTPAYLDPAARLVVGDIRNESLLSELVEGVDVVVHLAAHTGVGQSMYRLRDYVEVNSVGTATLLEQLIRPRATARLVIASSRAVYGEGAYRCGRCGPVSPLGRSTVELARGEWEVRCPICQGSVEAVATTELEPTRPGSVYGLSKLDQERLAFLVSDTYGLPVVGLRYFNVFGARQSLHNPYTGVVTTFVTRALNDLPAEVYEDGRESRDLVHVADVVQATMAAIDRPEAVGGTYNIGSGRALTLHEVASEISTALGGPPPVLSGRYRLGDIRHSLADLTRTRDVLGYEPKVDPGAGIAELARTLADQRSEDRSSLAAAELADHGLLGASGRCPTPRP
jgi:dTDP-L-rhamnose 4-epimerase